MKTNFKGVLTKFWDFNAFDANNVTVEVYFSAMPEPGSRFKFNYSGRTTTVANVTFVSDTYLEFETKNSQYRLEFEPF